MLLHARAAFLWMAAALTACGGGGGEGEAKPEGEAAKPPVELVAADVATVNVAPLARTLPLSGGLAPVVQATLKAKVSGEVLSLPLREGEAVAKGTVVARIDARMSTAQSDARQAGVERARADLAVAELELANNRRLREKNFIAQTVLDTSASQANAARAALKAAEAEARLASVGLDDATLRAPFDGLVAVRHVEPGEKVSPDTPLLTLVDLSQLELAAAVPVSEVPALRVGQAVRFTVDGFGSRAFEGRVERINPVAEAGTRQVMVYLAVPNPGGELKGGMFAKGRIELDAGAAAPVVPLAAVRDEAGLPFVLVVKDGTLSQRAVTLGLRSEEAGLVQVMQGLNAGEQVLTAGSSLLTAGVKVVLKPAAAK
jgi:RND family efflux transporter MFP subunit